MDAFDYVREPDIVYGYEYVYEYGVRGRRTSRRSRRGELRRAAERRR